MDPVNPDTPNSNHVSLRGPGGVFLIVAGILGLGASYYLLRTNGLKDRRWVLCGAVSTASIVAGAILRGTTPPEPVIPEIPEPPKPRKIEKTPGDPFLDELFERHTKKELQDKFVQTCTPKGLAWVLDNGSERQKEFIRRLDLFQRYRPAGPNTWEVLTEEPSSSDA